MTNFKYFYFKLYLGLVQDLFSKKLIQIIVKLLNIDIIKLLRSKFMKDKDGIGIIMLIVSIILFILNFY